MMAYADTGFLCSLYSSDAHSGRVIRWMNLRESPLPIVWLHQLELRNAFRLRVFRKQITAAQRDRSLNIFLADLAGGVLLSASVEHQATCFEAERLSAAFSERLGTRSLDVLHVATALVMGADQFLSFDARQLNLAEAAGLRIGAIPD